MEQRSSRNLHTVLCEVSIRDNNGEIVKNTFFWYSAPVAPWLAKALGEHLKSINQSYRIMTEDGRGKIVDQWLREGFVPSDGRGVET